jgi:uncharacterized protein (DUF488 family)
MGYSSHVRSQQPDAGPLNVWTIGHSTHAAEEFNQIVTTHKIELVADVRAFPSSRRYPQFNKENLTPSLAALDIKYQHLPLLGGRRKPSAQSVNLALKNPSFRAYADYMQTDDFRRGIASLLDLAALHRTAIMCAEALWWRCHRSLIADHLKTQGLRVIHLLSVTKTQDHVYTAAATVRDGKLSYGGLLST